MPAFKSKRAMDEVLTEKADFTAETNGSRHEAHMKLSTKRNHSGEDGVSIYKKPHVSERTSNDDGATDPTANKQKIAALMSLIPGKENRIEIYDKLRTIIGRSRSCDIVLHEADISTIHCELNLIRMEVDGRERKLINIVDRSRNGTYINGNKLVKKDCILKNGDRVVFGRSCSFLFRYHSESSLGQSENEREEATTERSNKDSDRTFRKPLFTVESTSIETRKVHDENQSFFDKYVLGKDLGSGHYAIVKEGINKQTGQHVAVKIFHPQKNDDHRKSKQFRVEMNILMQIHHPNIVNLLDSFVEPISKSQVQKYLILEKIVDGELFDRIVKKTCLRQDETKEIFKQILAGLKYLHDRNIIHRDIKPENILLNITKRTSPSQRQLGPWDEDEIDIQVKIADFGLAKFIGELHFTNTLCGTPSYVAPEVLAKKDYTSKVDMWSAGVILYVCLCGFPPFSEQLGPPSLKEQILQAKYAFYSPFWDNIDDCVLHLISKLLVADPKGRYSVDEALNHPWLREEIERPMPEEVKRTRLTGNKLPKTYTELSCV